MKFPREWKSDFQQYANENEHLKKINFLISFISKIVAFLLNGFYSHPKKWKCYNTMKLFSNITMTSIFYFAYLEI